MSQGTTASAVLGGHDTPMGAVRMPRNRRGEALSMIFGLGDPRGSECRTFVERAERQGMDLDLLWGVFGDGIGSKSAEAGKPLLSACLALVGSGRTAMLFAGSRKGAGLGQTGWGFGGLGGSGGSGSDAVCAAVRAVREEVTRDAEAVVLAQTLVEPRDAHVQGAFEKAGFRRIAELAYLRRALWSGERNGSAGQGSEAQDGESTGDVSLRFAELGRGKDDAGRGEERGVRVATMGELGAQAGERLLKEALEASYEETADCPELCGLRTTEDVIESHRGVGVYDPNLWWIVERGGRGVGCVLFNRCPDIASVELVYLGVGREIRGKGLGGALVRLGIERLTRRGPRGTDAGAEATLTCAVDVRNAAALRVYAGVGMRECARRVALVWARAWAERGAGA